MRIRLFVTEAQRQRARMRVIIRFYKAMAIVTVLFGLVLLLNYLWERMS